MSDSDAVDEIRERKREVLLERAGPDDGQSGAPDEPVHVEGEDHFAELTGDGVVLAEFYAD